MADLVIIDQDPRVDPEHVAERTVRMTFVGEDLVYSAGQGWAVEQIEAITHTGTHVDAPYHYGAESEGKPARTIDEVPLQWCFAPGVVLDMRHKAAGAFSLPPLYVPSGP